MYRFRPTDGMKAHPVDAYPAKSAQAAYVAPYPPYHTIPYHTIAPSTHTTQYSPLLPTFPVIWDGEITVSITSFDHLLGVPLYTFKVKSLFGNGGGQVHSAHDPEQPRPSSGAVPARAHHIRRQRQRLQQLGTVRLHRFNSYQCQYVTLEPFKGFNFYRCQRIFWSACTWCTGTRPASLRNASVYAAQPYMAVCWGHCLPLHLAFCAFVHLARLLWTERYG